MSREYNAELEKKYYSKDWPQEPKSFDHLDRYLRSWLNPESTFGGKSVLDVGAGECAYSRLIADRYHPERIVALDLFEERMRPAMRENKNPRLTFIQGDCRAMPLQGNLFDIVFGSGVLNRFPNLKGVLIEIRRVLKNRGLYIGIEPNLYNPVILFRYFFTRHSPNECPLTDHILKKDFEQSGFSVTLKFFYANLPRFHNRWIGTCMGIRAVKILAP